jgi:hypothetical protein
VAGDTVTINLPAGGITTGSMANKNAGAGKAVAVDGLTLTGTDAGNYVVAATTGITVDIARKALNAVYTGVNRVYDGSTAGSATGSSADVVFGDAVNISATGVFTGDGARNVGTGKTLSLLNGTLAGADAANYALVNTTGSTTASITPRPVTPAYTGLAKVYDGSPSALVQATGAGFISGDAAGRTGRSLCRAMLALAQELGLQVVAEGVETKEQAVWLQGIGCQHAQGWLYGRAMAPAAFERWFTSRSELGEAPAGAGQGLAQLA